MRQTFRFYILLIVESVYLTCHGCIPQLVWTQSQTAETPTFFQPPRKKLDFTTTIDWAVADLADATTPNVLAALSVATCSSVDVQ
tara:strand:+ start:3287 stop:3541 length:255 start_codon:yes stop_codon:yes gene_type:complete